MIGAAIFEQPAGTSEVLGLGWRSFCGDHFLIRDSAWNGKLLEDATKTGERRVYIPPSTHTAILRWREKAKDTSPDAVRFPSKPGTPMSAHNFHKRGTRAASQEAGPGCAAYVPSAATVPRNAKPAYAEGCASPSGSQEHRDHHGHLRTGNSGQRARNGDSG